MARSKKNVDGDIEPTKNTQEEIEAALARACGQKQVSSANSCQKETNSVGVQNTIKEQETNCGDIKLPELNASECLKVSSENQDKSIYDYVVSINNKIETECKIGGYSTNITLRVSPSAWVNVQHIVDWYRRHGFEVVVGETTHPQYGCSAGTMVYNLNISWVNS